jgi:hypothetical protein
VTSCGDDGSICTLQLRGGLAIGKAVNTVQTISLMGLALSPSIGDGVPRTLMFDSQIGPNPCKMFEYV